MYAKESQKLFEEPEHRGHMSKEERMFHFSNYQIPTFIKHQKACTMKLKREDKFSTYLLGEGANPMV